MHDLKKLEENFHNFLNMDNCDEDELRITEELFETGRRAYIPFGWMTHFLTIEDGKPVIYAHAVSRMDTDSICIITEDGHKCYDIYDGANADMKKRYLEHRGKLLRVDKRLRGIPKREY